MHMYNTIVPQDAMHTQFVYTGIIQLKNTHFSDNKKAIISYF